MNYIWVFGENLGKTMNNNSYYMWKYIVNNLNNRNLEPYYIAEMNPSNKKIYDSLSEWEKKYIIWRNSLKHIRLFYKADMFFVSLSFRDIQPDKVWKKNFQPLITQPLVYLQHGTLAMKQLGYGPNYCNNSLYKFIYYNKNIKEPLKEVNRFRDYQLYYGIVPPRYMELARRHNLRSNYSGTKILWFFTWREYFGNNLATNLFINKIKSVLTDKRLQEYLKGDNVLTVLVHDKFSKAQIEKIKNAVKGTNIRILSPSELDIMQALVDNDVLITDYSSVGFDFTTLNKPVILYQPDFDEYLKKRKLYCELDELEPYRILRKDELVNTIISGNYGINKFFSSRIQDVDLTDVESGSYIQRMYDYFWEKITNLIFFLGYDYSGIGGTVLATRALAEGLAEKDYLVRFLTFKRVTGYHYPYGIPNHPIYNRSKPKLTDKLKVALFRYAKKHAYLLNDPARDSLQPIAGIGMEYWMKHIHANTVVSTRESLHYFLDDATSPLIKNKLYFFHTAANVVNELYPAAIDNFKKRNIDNVLFVTEENKKALSENFDFNQYQNSCVLGNTLDSSRMIERDEIQPIDEKSVYYCAYVLRLGSERKSDIERMLAFGTYLKEHNIFNIVINVYGDGELKEWLLESIDNLDLFDYVVYKGKTNDIRALWRNNDLGVDFAYVQSFGMTYIESTLNGRLMYCFENEGSKEIFKDIPENIVSDFAELVHKIQNAHLVTQEKLESNYNKIYERYSREVVTDKFIRFLKRCEDNE